MLSFHTDKFESTLYMKSLSMPLTFSVHTLSPQEIFGSEISTLKGRSGILCAEHAGKSHEIYADGVCLTILIFTTTDKNPKDRNEFIWHRIRNASIIEDLEKRLQRPESSIPLFTHT